MICADEKAQPQALGRRHASLPPAPGRPGRFEFDHERNRTIAYLAGWDVHQAKLFDRVEEKTGSEPFDRLVEQAMTTEPYASARTVFWIVDNGSSHAGQASINRLKGNYDNLRLVHLPIHASWLNQIELYFSIVQRKALTRPASQVTLAPRLLWFSAERRMMRGESHVGGCGKDGSTQSLRLASKAWLSAGLGPAPRGLRLTPTVWRWAWPAAPVPGCGLESFPGSGP